MKKRKIGFNTKILRKPHTLVCESWVSKSPKSQRGASQTQILFDYRGKKFIIDVDKCDFFSRIRGLMFRSKESAEALLLLDSKKPIKLGIHSLFVFFSFIAIWLDDQDKIVDLLVVKPFTLFIKTKNPFNKLIEIPINKKYSKIAQLLCSQFHSSRC